MLVKLEAIKSKDIFPYPNLFYRFPGEIGHQDSRAGGKTPRTPQVAPRSAYENARETRITRFALDTSVYLCDSHISKQPILTLRGQRREASGGAATSSRYEEKREKVVNYIKKNKEVMEYWSYKAEGLPLGSGAVEGGCKLIGYRTNGCGRRWG
jgi:hypothetical protein